MSNILSLLRKFEALDTDRVSQDAVDQTSPEMVELNQQQMYAGKDKTGNDITPEYRPFTVQDKKERGQPYDRVTLFREGNFYAGMYARVQGDVIDQGSTDGKAAKIEKKYGNVFGIGGPYKVEYVIEHLRPAFINEIKRQTGL